MSLLVLLSWCERWSVLPAVSIGSRVVEYKQYCLELTRMVAKMCQYSMSRICINHDNFHILTIKFK